MEMSFKVSRNLIYLLTVLVGGVLLVLLSFPIFGRLTESWNKTTTLRKLVSSLTLKKDSLANVDPKLTNSTTTAMRALPTKIGVLTAIGELRVAAQDTGVEILKLQATVKEDEIPSFARIQVDVKGSLTNVDRFLKKVETSLPFIKIGGGKSSTTSELTQTSITLETYWKDNPEFPGIEVPLPILTGTENEFLKKLSMLKQLGGFTATSSGAVQSRSNPFSF